MYGKHRGRNACSDLSQHAIPVRSSDMWRFKCEIQVRGFQMTLTQGVKYGDINVHSVKCVIYRVGDIELTPHQLLECCSIWIPGLSSCLGLLTANFNPIISIPLHCSEKRAAERFCGWFQKSFMVLFKHFLILQVRHKLSTKEFSVPVVQHDLLGGE